MTAEQILHNHLANISLEIAKIDNTVSSTEKMPVEQLGVHRKKRTDLAETADYLKYLIFNERSQQQEKSGIIKQDNKIITM